MEKKLCLLFLVVNFHLTSSASHSLQYLHTTITPGVHFSTVDLVDGEQIDDYDSKIRKKILDNNFWTKEAESRQDHQDKFRRDMKSLMKRFSWPEGHKVQWMYGCELYDDGTTRGYSRYSYDGEDFLTLDLNTLSWTAANDKADIMKQEWESEDWAVHIKDYLENECIDWLKKFVKYGRETLKRKDESSAGRSVGDSDGGSDGGSYGRSDGGPVGVIVGVLVAVLLLVSVGVGVFIWKKKQSDFKPVSRNSKRPV